MSFKTIEVSKISVHGSSDYGPVSGLVAGLENGWLRHTGLQARSFPGASHDALGLNRQPYGLTIEIPSVRPTHSVVGYVGVAIDRSLAIGAIHAVLTIIVGDEDPQSRSYELGDTNHPYVALAAVGLTPDGRLVVRMSDKPRGASDFAAFLRPSTPVTKRPRAVRRATGHPTQAKRT